MTIVHIGPSKLPVSFPLGKANGGRIRAIWLAASQRRAAIGTDRRNSAVEGGLSHTAGGAASLARRIGQVMDGPA